MGKWATLNANCQKFNGIYKHLKHFIRSGENNVDLLNRAMSPFKDKKKGRWFTQYGPWAILRKYPKWDAAKLIDSVDVTGHTELFGDCPRPRLPNKSRPTKKTKSETTSGITRSNPQDFEDTFQNEFRLNREAVKEMYAMTKSNDVTIMKLEEMNVLFIYLFILYFFKFL